MIAPAGAAARNERRSSRVSAAERRTLILAAARRVFSRHGYEAARTQEIARSAGISEALMYRHFRSKRALHTAVLRQIIHDQNQNYALIGLQDLTPRGLIHNLHDYFTIATGSGPDHVRDGFRLLLSSVVGEQGFAFQIYRRAQRMQISRLRQVLAQAAADGDIAGPLLTVENTSMFIEHVGTMLNALCRDIAQAPYSGDPRAIARDATRFAARGVGFTDAAIDRHLAALPSAAA